ncbi:MAG: F0F1 ATP synthase subunit A [candidate division Zixibacteria bacterium]|nr:F0F1 ATP synthase subunit A [candidate division Zixibacteria bacterium]
MILEKLLIPLASGAEHAAHATDTAAAHGGGPPELPNLVHMIYLAFGETFHSWHVWENVIYGFVVLLLLCVVSMRVYRRRKLVPGKLQNVAEMAVEGLDSFFHSIIGKHSRPFTPFLGTLFIYVLCMNLMGLVPLMKSPTSSMNITLSLALVVFFYVQYAGMRRLGIIKYIDHFLGEPRDVMGWILVPINLPIHFISELAKPVSLSLRLFGNITGEDVLIAAFTFLGITMLGFLHGAVATPEWARIGIPLQLPFYFLALLTSTIQALVFTLLSTVYFAMMMPHEEEEH